MFDGRTAAALHTFGDQVGYKVATYAEDQIQQRLREVLQHPTGYYQSRITVDRAGSGYRVSDGGVIYGPWLEGTGSRNSPVTRFPGYATFRRTKALVDRKAPQIAYELLARYKAMGLL
ncbi:hypothetical protein IPZ58_07505 [Streptomyces roseoverticillatus]|uniref:hypothetical protein n=1 Tax=Streptomyces roseoverticillatus TaxID=66429 RepID=UPI001F17EBF6|nr:hypothetical protein [Streptomyces roseoverticillatus]MCF3101425.1 hypothetical protein [Streptomyces roseoverticillatus]